MGTKTEKYCPECFGEFTNDVNECPVHKCPLITLPGQESLVGRVIADKYEVTHQIGVGGMGTVYRAKQRLLGRQVALKVLRPDFVRDVTAVKRFFVEAKAASKLRCPNSVILYDFGMDDEGLLFYTMELLKGASLSRILSSRGHLTTGQALQVAVDVCSALEEAHGNSIVHRDLKPDNIMIVPDGKKELARVLDFGIAKLLYRDDGTGLTKTGMICGTPEYMSPEQASGKPVGPPSDLYSLGIVLYQMLCGALPFASGTPVNALVQHINKKPRPIAKANPDVDVDPQVQLLIDRLLAKDHRGRPATAEELRLELQKLLTPHLEGEQRIQRISTAPGESPTEILAKEGIDKSVMEEEETEPDPSWDGTYVDRSSLVGNTQGRKMAANGPADSGKKAGIPSWLVAMLIGTFLGVTVVTAGMVIHNWSKAPAVVKGEDIAEAVPQGTDATTPAGDVQVKDVIPDVIQAPDHKPEVATEVEDTGPAPYIHQVGAPDALPASVNTNDTSSPIVDVVADVAVDSTPETRSREEAVQPPSEKKRRIKKINRVKKPPPKEDKQPKVDKQPVEVEKPVEKPPVDKTENKKEGKGLGLDDVE